MFLTKILSTYLLKNNDDLVGYYELIFNGEKQEIEIAYFGILEEYFGKKIRRIFIN